MSRQIGSNHLLDTTDNRDQEQVRYPVIYQTPRGPSHRGSKMVGGVNTKPGFQIPQTSAKNLRTPSRKVYAGNDRNQGNAAISTPRRALGQLGNAKTSNASRRIEDHTKSRLQESPEDKLKSASAFAAFSSGFRSSEELVSRQSPVPICEPSSQYFTAASSDGVGFTSVFDSKDSRDQSNSSLSALINSAAAAVAGKCGPSRSKSSGNFSFNSKKKTTQHTTFTNHSASGELANAATAQSSRGPGSAQQKLSSHGRALSERESNRQIAIPSQNVPAHRRAASTTGTIQDQASGAHQAFMASVSQPKLAMPFATNPNSGMLQPSLGVSMPERHLFHATAPGAFKTGVPVPVPFPPFSHTSQGRPLQPMMVSPEEGGSFVTTRPLTLPPPGIPPAGPHEGESHHQNQAPEMIAQTVNSKRRGSQSRAKQKVVKQRNPPLVVAIPKIKDQAKLSPMAAATPASAQTVPVSAESGRHPRQEDATLNIEKDSARSSHGNQTKSIASQNNWLGFKGNGRASSAAALGQYPSPQPMASRPLPPTVFKTPGEPHSVAADRKAREARQRSASLASHDRRYTDQSPTKPGSAILEARKLLGSSMQVKTPSSSSCSREGQMMSVAVPWPTPASERCGHDATTASPFVGGRKVQQRGTTTRPSFLPSLDQAYVAPPKTAIRHIGTARTDPKRSANCELAAAPVAHRGHDVIDHSINIPRPSSATPMEGCRSTAGCQKLHPIRRVRSIHEIAPPRSTQRQHISALAKAFPLGGCIVGAPAVSVPTGNNFATRKPSNSFTETRKLLLQKKFSVAENHRHYTNVSMVDLVREYSGSLSPAALEARKDQDERVARQFDVGYTTERPFSCEGCRKRYKNRNGLSYHIGRCRSFQSLLDSFTAITETRNRCLCNTGECADCVSLGEPLMQYSCRTLRMLDRIYRKKNNLLEGPPTIIVKERERIAARIQHAKNEALAVERDRCISERADNLTQVARMQRFMEQGTSKQGAMMLQGAHSDGISPMQQSVRKRRFSESAADVGTPQRRLKRNACANKGERSQSTVLDPILPETKLVGINVPTMSPPGPSSALEALRQSTNGLSNPCADDALADGDDGKVLASDDSTMKAIATCLNDANALPSTDRLDDMVWKSLHAVASHSTGFLANANELPVSQDAALEAAFGDSVLAGALGLDAMPLASVNPQMIGNEEATMPGMETTFANGSKLAAELLSSDIQGLGFDPNLLPLSDDLQTAFGLGFGNMGVDSMIRDPTTGCNYDGVSAKINPVTLPLELSMGNNQSLMDSSSEAGMPFPWDELGDASNIFQLTDGLDYNPFLSPPQSEADGKIQGLSIPPMPLGNLNARLDGIMTTKTQVNTDEKAGAECLKDLPGKSTSCGEEGAAEKPEEGVELESDENAHKTDEPSMRNQHFEPKTSSNPLADVTMDGSGLGITDDSKELNYENLFQFSDEICSSPTSVAATADLSTIPDLTFAMSSENSTDQNNRAGQKAEGTSTNRPALSEVTNIAAGLKSNLSRPTKNTDSVISLWGSSMGQGLL